MTIPISGVRTWLAFGWIPEYEVLDTTPWQMRALVHHLWWRDVLAHRAQIDITKLCQ